MTSQAVPSTTPQFGDPRTVEISEADPNYKCCFCGRSEVNAAEWGILLKLDDVVAHHFCLLFSALLEQYGRDNEGIYAFLPENIKAEVKRGKRLKCKFCKKGGATIGCAVKQCRQSYHYPCGYQNGALFEFYGQFQSYCTKHKARQQIPEGTIHECPICISNVDESTVDDAVWPPCCGKQVFHRGCIMRTAKAAGYFFKCPLCNSKEQIFIQAMKANGVFVPEQDAEWETEPNAFRELLTHYSHCDAINCLCPYGRDSSEKEPEMWTIIRCHYCASSATHLGCTTIKNQKWKCEGCRALFTSNSCNNDSNDEASSSGAEDDDDVEDEDNSSSGSDSDSDESDETVGALGEEDVPNPSVILNAQNPQDPMSCLPIIQLTNIVTPLLLEKTDTTALEGGQTYDARPTFMLDMAYGISSIEEKKTDESKTDQGQESHCIGGQQQIYQTRDFEGLACSLSHAHSHLFHQNTTQSAAISEMILQGKYRLMPQILWDQMGVRPTQAVQERYLGKFVSASAQPNQEKLAQTHSHDELLTQTVQAQPTAEPTLKVVQPQPTSEPTLKVVQPQPTAEPNLQVVQPQPTSEPTLQVVQPQPTAEPNLKLVQPQPTAEHTAPCTVPPHPQPTALPTAPRTVPLETTALPTAPFTLPPQPKVLPSACIPLSQRTAPPSALRTVLSQATVPPTSPRTLLVQPTAVPTAPRILLPQPTAQPRPPSILLPKPTTLPPAPLVVQSKQTAPPAAPQTLQPQPQLAPVLQTAQPPELEPVLQKKSEAPRTSPRSLRRAAEGQASSDKHAQSTPIIAMARIQSPSPKKRATGQRRSPQKLAPKQTVQSDLDHVLEKPNTQTAQPLAQFQCSSDNYVQITPTIEPDPRSSIEQFQALKFTEQLQAHKSNEQLQPHKSIEQFQALNSTEQLHPRSPTKRVQPGRLQSTEKLVQSKASPHAAEQTAPPPAQTVAKPFAQADSPFKKSSAFTQSKRHATSEASIPKRSLLAVPEAQAPNTQQTTMSKYLSSLKPKVVARIPETTTKEIPFKGDPGRLGQRLSSSLPSSTFTSSSNVLGIRNGDGHNLGVVSSGGDRRRRKSGAIPDHEQKVKSLSELTSLGEDSGDDDIEEIEPEFIVEKVVLGKRGNGTSAALRALLKGPSSNQRRSKMSYFSSSKSTLSCALTEIRTRALTERRHHDYRITKSTTKPSDIVCLDLDDDEDVTTGVKTGSSGAGSHDSGKGPAESKRRRRL